MSSIDIKTTTLQPLRRNRVYWTIADALILAKRQLKQIPRIPEELVFSTIQPIMFVLLFRYVFGGAIAVTGTTYVNYLMAGIFVPDHRVRVNLNRHRHCPGFAARVD